METLSPQQRESVDRARFFKLAGSDPDAALAMARGEADPGARSKMMMSVIVRMQSIDLSRAAEIWLTEAAHTGRVLPDAGHRVIFEVAQNQGVDAVLRLLDRLPASAATAIDWAPRSIASAIGWPAVAEAAAHLPHGARRGEWLEQAIGGLMSAGEVGTAQQLVARLPDGPERAAATRSMAAALFPQDPEMAAQTLLRLDDGGVSLQAELRRWLKADAPEARRWIAATSMLGAEQKGALLQPSTAVP
ncbi:MAG: hypothetical protein M3463_09205 [Verrucomicrobiota bacterium]|nr:hypothetical protein [Verrucomicrobiota bacterium]